MSESKISDQTEKGLRLSKGTEKSHNCIDVDVFSAGLAASKLETMRYSCIRDMMVLRMRIVIRSNCVDEQNEQNMIFTLIKLEI